MRAVHAVLLGKMTHPETLREKKEKKRIPKYKVVLSPFIHQFIPFFYLFYFFLFFTYFYEL